MPLLTTTTTISLIGTFKEEILTACKDIKKEVLFFLDDGLSDYLNSITNKFQNTKTFLYRNESVNFYDVFFPVSIRISNSSRKITTCNDLFVKSNFVSIIGSAGSGKTMLMKHFFLQSIESSFKIPLFIELRNLNDFSGNFTELIYEVIFNNGLSPDMKILERLLESGNFILLLDGYDEIYSDKKNSVTSDLDKFIDRYSKNCYIISSRPGSGVEAIPRFNNYSVMPLNKNEIIDFIDLVLKSIDDPDLGNKIKDVIAKPENKDYSNFLSSPLLLSMFILTFNQYPELPKKKSKFYWNVFDTLTTKHDSFTKKGGYQHERRSGLQNEEFEKILQWFSYRALFNGKLNFDSQYLTTSLNEIKKELNMSFNTEFLIADLTVAISILTIDGMEYKFPHKSLQEYFAAMLIKDLPIVSKEKIYQIRFEQQAQNTTGGSENLWNLCYEVDKLSFNKYFVLYFLKKFQNNFNGLDNVERVKKMYYLSHIGEQFVDNGNLSFSVSGSHTRQSNFTIYIILLQYLNLNKYPFFKILSNTHDTLKDDFNTYLRRKFRKASINNIHQKKFRELFISPHQDWDSDLEALMLRANIFEQFQDTLNSISSKIDKIENEIKTEEEASFKLLGI